MGLFEDKTRWQHFWVGVRLGATLTILCCLGAMTAAEFKDEQHGGVWDWKDWWCGMLGGLLGQALQVGIILLLWKI